MKDKPIPGYNRPLDWSNQSNEDLAWWVERLALIHEKGMLTEVAKRLRTQGVVNL